MEGTRVLPQALWDEGALLSLGVSTVGTAWDTAPPLKFHRTAGRMGSRD